MKSTAVRQGILLLLASLLPSAPIRAQTHDSGKAAAARPVFPGREWQTATPESQGLSGTKLDAAAAYAEKHGGGSGCVIRHGYLVKEWGDPRKLADIKSATKGAVGATLLGLAVDAGLVALDDRAVKHYPAIGVERPDNPRDRLARDHDPPPGHDDRGLRRRPAAEAGLSARHRRHLLERRREHAGRAV